MKGLLGIEDSDARRDAGDSGPGAAIFRRVPGSASASSTCCGAAWW